MCLSLNLVQPTQRLHDLELQHLQRVAISPHLFNTVVEVNGCSKYDDERTTLRLKSTTSFRRRDFLNPRFEVMKLLRGGRYLFTLDGDLVEKVLQVWDLGVPGRRLLSRPRVVGTLQVNSSGFDMGAWAIAQEGESVRLAIATNRPAR